MKKTIAVSWIFLWGCTSLLGTVLAAPAQTEAETDEYELLREIIVAEFSGATPHEWGESVSGVKTHLKTAEKVVALGLDTCAMTEKGEELKLIRFFEAEKVPVTLFVCGEWMDRNAGVLKRLSANPFFEIANQGLAYKTCSVNGKSAAGAAGTSSIEEVFAEVEKNARRIETITGSLPQYYRAGAGYYDEVAVRIVNALGYEAVGSNIRMPEGTAVTREQILEAFLNPSAGAVAILKPAMLTPAASSAIVEVVRKLRKKGYQFVKLSDYPLE